MITIRKKAEEIGNAQGISEIILIINIIVNCIKLYYSCKKKPSDIKQSLISGNFSLLERVQLRKTILKEVGILHIKEKRREIEAAIIQMAKSLSDDELNQMFNECKEK